MCRITKCFEKAIALAMKSDVKKSQHGAVCVKHGTIIGRGSNKLRNRFSMPTFSGKNVPYILRNHRSCHAEVSTLLDGLRRYHQKPNKVKGC